MKKLKKLLLKSVFGILVGSFVILTASPLVSAASEGSYTCTYTGGFSIPECSGEASYNCKSEESLNTCSKNNPIVVWLSFFINMLAAIVGIGAIIMVIVAGLQYSAARDNPQGIQAAKQKLTNVLIGIAAFVFMYAFLQWLIPGGVF